MPVTSPLRWFQVGEFHHPELVQDAAAVWLDDIREYADFPLVLTSDARTPEENAAASGSSPTSLHLLGRAFDLQYPGDAEQVWRLVEAVFVVSRSRPVELELVHSATDQHVHLGLLAEDRESRLIIRAD
jgi:hypothetical protein